MSKEPLSVGDHVLDRYRVQEKIAVGGHSIVYLGEDERLSRPVCIKVFHKISTSDGIWRASYEHFVQEAFALSKLSHPNTLRIFDFGHIDESDSESPRMPFQVSEYVNGGTLSRLVRVDGPLSVDDSIELVDALCGALAEAHSHGIIHRDLKPKNILFGTAGPSRTIKLADFGIAKSQRVDEQLRFRAGDTDVVAGERLAMMSPRWAAPEQITGEAVGPQTDIYSLALIMAFAMTGQVVFSSSDVDIALKLRAASDAQIEQAFASTDLPAALESLLKRACSMDADERPNDVAAFGAEFAAAVLGADRTRAPTHLTPVPPAPPEDTPAQAAPATTAQHLRAADGPRQIGDRYGTFARAADGVADLSISGGQVRVRLTLMPTSGTQFCLHAKGLSCFVARGGDRAAAAVQLEESGSIDFVLPNQQRIARATVSFGSPAAGHTVFDIGHEKIALSLDECPRVVLLDFGPNAECFIVFQPPASRAQESAEARSARRWRRGSTQNQ